MIISFNLLDNLLLEVAMDTLVFKYSESMYEFKFHNILRDKFSKEETMIISDWDDTLNISHIFIGEYAKYADITKEISEIPKELQQVFATVEEASRIFLTEASKYGNVVIVTNATEGWVEASCKRFMPNIYALVTSFSIVSARSLYELYSPSPDKWKEDAFRDIVLTHFSTTPKIRKNIISIGDGPSEQYAMRNLLLSCKEKTDISLITTKIIRLTVKPTSTCMSNQLALLCVNLEEIVHSVIPFDIELAFSMDIIFRYIPRVLSEFYLTPFTSLHKEATEEKKENILLP